MQIFIFVLLCWFLRITTSHEDDEYQDLVYHYEDNYSQLESCSAFISRDGLYTTFQSTSQTCLARIRVLEGSYLKFTADKLEAYCEHMKSQGYSIEMLDETHQNSVDLCKHTEKETYLLGPGEHLFLYQAVPHKKLHFSIKNINTDLECGDRVTLDQMGIPLNVTNRRQRTTCTIYLPGSANITIHPFDGGNKCSNYVRLRQGRNKYELRQEKRLCSPKEARHVSVVCNAASLTLHSELRQTIRFEIASLPNNSQLSLRRLRC